MDFSALPEGAEPLAVERVPTGFPSVRNAPESDRLLRRREMTRWATRGHCSFKRFQGFLCHVNKGAELWR
jgi:hypothetical protein